MEKVHANNSGDLYLNVLKVIGEAITKVVLGQTATAGEGGAWSNDKAQGLVRQDILDADCRAIEASVNEQLLKPLQAFLYPQLKDNLRLVINSIPPSDINAEYEAKKNKYDAMGVAIRAGILTPSSDIEAFVREDLNLPPISEVVKLSWENSKGVRAPSTLAKESEQPQDPNMLSLAENKNQGVNTQKFADQAVIEAVKSGALQEMFGDTYNAIEQVSNSDDTQFDEALKNLVNNPKTANTEPFERVLEDEIYKAINARRHK